MSEAATVEAPKVVRRGPKRAAEFDSRSVKIEQKPTLEHPPIDQPMEHPSTIVQVDKELSKLDVSKLAFAEDPIKIIIHRNPDPKFSPKCTDYIAVNGKPAEMMFKNGWIPIGYLPRGVSFYTKRKYVEVLARAKQDTIHTNVIERVNEDPQNLTDTVTTSVLAFTIIEDKNPLGGPWIEELIRQQL